MVTMMTHPNASAPGSAKITVYYDGACPICTGSVKRLQSRDHRGVIEAISTADEGFDPDREGLRKELLGKVMQVKDADGNIHAGLDGMIVAWKAVPAFRFIGWVASIPGIYHVGKLFYVWFARNRYRFARRCDSVSCRPQP